MNRPHNKQYISITLSRSTVERMICGGIQSAINDHGPITKELSGSVAKRVAGHLYGLSEQKRKEKEGHESMGTSDS